MVDDTISSDPADAGHASGSAAARQRLEQALDALQTSIAAAARAPSEAPAVEPVEPVASQPDAALQAALAERDAECERLAAELAALQRRHSGLADTVEAANRDLATTIARVEAVIRG